jgi:hypothetical protein
LLCGIILNFRHKPERHASVEVKGDLVVTVGKVDMQNAGAWLSFTRLHLEVNLAVGKTTRRN